MNSIKHQYIDLDRPEGTLSVINHTLLSTIRVLQQVQVWPIIAQTIAGVLIV